MLSDIFCEFLYEIVTPERFHDLVTSFEVEALAEPQCPPSWDFELVLSALKSEA